MEIEIGVQGMIGDGLKMRVTVDFVYLDKEEMITNKKGEKIQSITPAKTIALLTLENVMADGRYDTSRLFEGMAFAHPTKDRHCSSHWAGRKIALRRAMLAAKMHPLERAEVWNGLAEKGIRWGKRASRSDREIRKLLEVLCKISEGAENSIPPFWGMGSMELRKLARRAVESYLRSKRASRDLLQLWHEMRGPHRHPRGVTCDLYDGQECKDRPPKKEADKLL